ncbi:helix-turn-helix domain-containing protein [Paraburkholderia fungorum]|uniref:helix-turn-helix domain-containing protein n=1 Tax=Paraburkholderia fungorum TaxID=134537 RepID=UPI0004AAADC6|nr:helix-turn-helix domain-containing protein [Paraburkholderia fungorum]KFX61032.1 helix-turn-helix family protein [Burkholderia sp. K24]USX10501.1 helix-turn-helix domain-containing protein [Paraburkholderia fungorum]
MKTTVEYLDALREKLHLPSDYAAAKVLGVTPSTVSKYRLGRSVFDEKVAIQAAELIGIDPLEVISACKAESASDDHIRAVWTGAWEKFSVGFRSLVLRANACGAFVPQV